MECYEQGLDDPASSLSSMWWRRDPYDTVLIRPETGETLHESRRRAARTRRGTALALFLIPVVVGTISIGSWQFGAIGIAVAVVNGIAWEVFARRHWPRLQPPVSRERPDRRLPSGSQDRRTQMRARNRTFGIGAVREARSTNSATSVSSLVRDPGRNRENRRTAGAGRY